MPKHKKQKAGKLLYIILIIFLSASSGLISLVLTLKDLPSLEQIETRQLAQSTKIYDRSGNVFLYEIYGEEKRTAISFNDIPDYVKWATVAIEDDNFYQNPALDWRAILRALFTNLIHGRIAQGGSTITQQLAKNAFLSPEKTMVRKIKELLLALKLEKRYSKDEILNFYLNQIPYGGNAYGVEAAAQTFFSESAKNLGLPEAALLASLPKAPSYYSPWGKHLNELLERKNNVLEKMQILGYIDTEEKERAQKFELKFAPQTTGIKAPHFVLEIQEYLNQKFGEEFVRTAGLIVGTTLDWKLQQIAEKAVAEGAERNKNLYQGYNAALVAQDAKTGQILAMVGSKDYFTEPEPKGCKQGDDCRFEGNFNVATQGLRQPGSAMKPFVYAAAFQKGYTPETIVFDLPTEFAANNPNCPTEADLFNDNHDCFHPQNFNEKFIGPVKLKTALAQSINIPAAKTLYLAGIDNVLGLMKDFGVNTLTERSRYGLSLVLGGGEVTLKELTGAYSVLAQEGIKHQQTMILKITDSKNRVLEEYKNNAILIIDSQYPRLINNILTDIEERAGLFTGSLPLTIFPGHEVALKTGTTNDYRDAWAMGYTPELTVGVWAGNNDNTPMQQHGSSILAAVPIWSSFMKEALQGRELITFNKPAPAFGPKAMLRGEYIVNYKAGDRAYPQIHNLLYYIDKNNPGGPFPTDPENDPQFKNWEGPVIKWAEKNIPNFSGEYNAPLPQGGQPETESAPLKPGIEIIAPQNGIFIKPGNIINIQAKISGQFNISKIQLLFNDKLIDERAGDFDKDAAYQFNLLPPKLELQNSLKIKAADSRGNESIKEVILFR